MTTTNERIAIIGGTGPLGSGLAIRWLRAGYQVIIGSRSIERAHQKAEELRALIPGARVEGKALVEATQEAEIVVLAVPYAGHSETLEVIKDAAQGKILIDATVPLRPPAVGRVQLPESDSAAVEAQDILGEGVDVVSAFHNIGAHSLHSGAPIHCDVLVAGNKPAAREVVIKLAEAAGMRAWHAGPLANSTAAEALTSVLIQINRKYGFTASGIRITPGSEPDKSDASG